jgi:hypothetical protein
MKKVYQTRFGGSDSPRAEQGNCFQACIATIFGLQLEDAFDCLICDEGHWFDEFQRWLKPYGLACVYVSHGGYCGDAGIFIQDRKSTTLKNPDDGHVVLAWMEDGHVIVVHDPNPNARELGEVKGAFMFVPISKEKFVGRRDWTPLIDGTSG